MYCPNCGKDCGDANFCPVCGLELESIAQSKPQESFEQKERRLKASGEAFCPFCLSTSVALQERKQSYFVGRYAGIFKLIEDITTSREERKYGRTCVCLKCNEEWYPKMFALNDRARALLDVLFMGRESVTYATEYNGHVELVKTGIYFYRDLKCVYSIGYSQITAIAFREALGPLPGRLTIRDEESWKKRFPRTFEAARKDDRTVFFYRKDTKTFRLLRDMLLKVIEENKKAGVCK